MNLYNRPRERTPPVRFNDRRPSASSNNQNPSTFGSRNNVDANQTPLGREVPRGPKADAIRGSSVFGPRGRGGYVGRPDFRDRDRDPRDFREGPSTYRRDSDRTDYLRRDRDAGISERENSANREIRGYSARDRSASPSRVRRDSRDGPPSLSARSSEGPPSWYNAASRGASLRGRGRGDWDRGRGRSSFTGDRDRDGFRNRSRSRESWRDRDWDRDRARDSDIERRDRFDRRDLDRPLDRDNQERGYDSWRRDQSVGHNSIGSAGASGSSAVASTRPTLDPRASSSERTSDRQAFAAVRRYSTTLTSTDLPRDSRREQDRGDYFGSKIDVPPKEAQASRASSPPAPPQVPAFGASLENLKPALAALPPTTPVPVHEVSPSAQTTPVIDSTASSQPFQPPTGPKAERATAPPAREPRPQIDLWQKSDTQQRPARALANGTPQKAIQDARQSVADSRDARRPGVSDVPAVQSIPTGPRAAFTSNIKPRPPYMQNAAPTTPATSRQSSSILSSMDHRAAPPPSSRMLQPRGNLGSGSQQWHSPDYKPPRPSIMNTMAPKHPSGDRDRSYNPQATSRHIYNHSQAASQPRRMFQQTSKTLRPMPADLDRPSALARDISLYEEHGGADDVEMTEIPLSLEQSSEDEAEEEEGLDEDDFADSEEKFQREMRLLAEKKPPHPLEDHAIVTLLLKIQMLGMIVAGAVPPDLQAAGEENDMMDVKEAPISGLLSPKVEEEKEAPPPPMGRLLKNPPVNTIPTPPMEDLPYLVRRTDVDDEVPRLDRWEYDSEGDDVTDKLFERFEHIALDQRDLLEKLRSDFLVDFRVWSIDRAYSDRQKKRESSAITPAPASPAPSSLGPLPLQTPGAERPTRGAKNISEFDLQNILRASEQSAREEQEKRDREATSKPNYDLEAVIPDMLSIQESEVSRFEDTNNLTAPIRALEVFAFIPPQDDFTNEEQQIFIQTFCQTPKKWGKIAAALEGRDYQQCLMHYYLTKNEADYKALYTSARPSKKGRRAKPKGGLRASALLSEMVFDGDEANGLAAVTDTGRPRRAAAPTFGDPTTDNEAQFPASGTSRRLLAASKDGNGELILEKVTGKGRKPGVVKARRTKKEIQQAQQLLQAPTELGLVSSPQRLERTPGMAGKALKGMRGGLLGPKPEEQMLEPQYPLEIDISKPHFANAGTDGFFHSGSAAPVNGNQPSSYWSVPEQQKFPNLVAFFGRDFQAIADFMKSKTVTMIKNYYARSISEGKNPALERAAHEADERRERGEPPGSPPTPVQPPKRRYDQTPSGISQAQRTIASSGEPVVIEDDGLPPPNRPSIIDDFVPPNMPINLQRNLSGDMAVRSRMPQPLQSRTATSLLPQQRLDESLQNLRSPASIPSRQTLGPRSGFFAEESREARPPTMVGQGLAQQHAPFYQASSRNLDRARVDLPQRQSSLLTQQGLPSQSVGGLLQMQQQTQVSARSPPMFLREPSISQQITSQHSHVRRLSSTTPSNSLQTILKQETEPAPLRRQDSLNNNYRYGQSPAQSPVISRPQMSFSLGPPRDPPRTVSTPVAPPVESTRPTPAKRSNLMSILNDEPSDPTPPPAKRPSLEPNPPQSRASPPLSTFGRTTSTLQPQQSHRREEASLLQQPSRSPFSQEPAAMPSSRGPFHEERPSLEQAQSFSATQSRSDWIHRYDPRPSSSIVDQTGRSQHQSTTPYSVQPPGPQPQQVSGLQQSLGQTHHRTMLASLQHGLGHAPSPPPLQQQSSVAPPGPYRTSSTSSQHGRIPSYGHSNQSSMHSSDTSASVQAQAQTSHPHSALTSPVPSMNRPHSSITFESRNAVHQLPSYAEQHNRVQHEREQAMQMQMQQQQRERQRQQELLQIGEQRLRQQLIDGRYSGPDGTFTPPASVYQSQQQDHRRQYSQGGEERR